MRKQQFFICRHCGNLAGMVKNAGPRMVCCGDEMDELIPNTSDGAGEKHVPVITVSGDTVTVKVGSVEHPSTPEHYIQWIYLETENGGQRKMLKPGDKPEASFKLVDDKPLGAFEYCNLHGLWVAAVQG